MGSPTAGFSDVSWLRSFVGQQGGLYYPFSVTIVLQPVAEGDVGYGGRSGTRRRSLFVDDRNRARQQPDAVVPVVIHNGRVFRLDLAGSDTYQRYLREMGRLKKFTFVLERLEAACQDLTRAARPGRPPATWKEWVARRRRNGDAIWARLCYASHVRLGESYMVRFLNQVALYAASDDRDERRLALRAKKAVDQIMFRSDWRGRGGKRADTDAHEIDALWTKRPLLIEQLKKAWKPLPKGEGHERVVQLREVFAAQGFTVTTVPSGLVDKPPGRVVDKLVAQLSKIGQVRLRKGRRPDYERDYEFVRVGFTVRRNHRSK